MGCYYLLMENEVKSGVSGVVVYLQNEFGEASGMVIKRFRAMQGSFDIDLDYKNEVAVLTVLEAHHTELPFQIPQITEHTSFAREEWETEVGPTAHIKMTRLDNPIVDDNSESSPNLTNADWMRQAEEAGKAAAYLHSLSLSENEKVALTRDPVESITSRLENHRMAKIFPEQISQISSLLKNMSGEHVFVHNDLHSGNLFAESISSQIEGICDFCFSGLGVREIDAAQYIKGGRLDAFIKGYESVSETPLNQRNLDIMEALSSLRTQLCDALEFENKLRDISKDENLSVANPSVA